MVVPVAAIVRLWGREVGAVAWDAERNLGAFEFTPDFPASGYDLAPLQMPLDQARGQVFEFPTLSHETFRGLPGLLADALPDKFGNTIIDTWLARSGRDAAGFSPVERLCYTGARGMGALEFEPTVIPALDRAVPVEVSELVVLARESIAHRGRLDVRRGKDEQAKSGAMLDILRVGTSAGGARPKAVIAINAEGRILSGQTTAPAGYDYWILKFDGVSDLELGAPKGYGRIEYAYYLMAKAAGIVMHESRLLEEGGRAHFLTRRFDRENGEKLHLQSLCGIAHYDFNASGAYGYEQAFEIMRKLRLTKAEAAQQYRRMLFNVVARNQDDHTKNIAFLMDRDGHWRLAPAFDVIYANNPKGVWTRRHQMTINGKRDGFTREDLLAVGRSIGLARPAEVLDEIVETVSRWPGFARDAGVPNARAQEIGAQHRLKG